MSSRRSQGLSVLLGLALLGAIAVCFGFFLRWLWHQLTDINPDLAVGVLTASTTVIVATVTVMLGRYYERRREVDTHFRDKKLDIYDSMLKELFDLDKQHQSLELAKFFREWQRKMIVWGGPSVLNAYVDWMRSVRTGRLDAETLFAMEKFFLAMRKDLGLSNAGVTSGLLLHLYLRHADLFLKMAKENPSITPAELSAKEKELGLET